MPADEASPIYVSMTSIFGVEREYSRPLVGAVPGRKVYGTIIGMMRRQGGRLGLVEYLLVVVVPNEDAVRYRRGSSRWEWSWQPSFLDAHQVIGATPSKYNSSVPIKMGVTTPEPEVAQNKRDL